MSRRSRPPRNRKSHNPGAHSDEVRRNLANDVAIAAIAPASPLPTEARVSGASASPAIPDASDELAELDAGWD